MQKFRNHTPQRKYTGQPKSSYKDYLDILADDFNNRCGYTDCLDSWWLDGFHIDHFVPKNPRHVTDEDLKKKFAELENVYSNLIYACPQVNRAKSDDWPTGDPTLATNSTEGYLSPHTDFNEYFTRTDYGAILPKDNPHAKYMWKRLKLYLRLYELLWRMEQIEETSRKLKTLYETGEIKEKYGEVIDAKTAALMREFLKYREYLGLDYRNIIRGSL